MASEILSLSKSVEEMSINGEEPPTRFILKEATYGPIEFCPSIGPIPIIDVSHFFPNPLQSQDEVDLELLKLKSALTSVGCFQIVGHGISTSYLDKVRETAKKFFQLPLEEKKKYGRINNEAEGYGSDVVVSQNQILDWSHRLMLMTYPESKIRINLWPENPSDFREILHEYTAKVKYVTEILFKTMAKLLNLEENSFLNKFGDEPLIRARFNFYPQCSRPDLVLGLKAHTDRSGITVLLQDNEVEGLQVLKDDKWVRVPLVPHALTINLGDPMQIMSNGIFKSPLHRVVTNSEKMRMSLAMFSESEAEREFGPLDSLVDEKRPRLYKNVKNISAINYECYQTGRFKIAVDCVKIDA